MDSPWYDAPRDILQVIAEKIDELSDFIHFSVVCKPWRCVYMENRQRLPYKLPMRLCHPHQLAVPLLLRSSKQDSDSREFICLSDKKVYDGFFLPEAANKWICGSSWGWLVTVDLYSEEIHLLNPFTRVQIRLPPLGSFTRHDKKFDDAIDFSYIVKAIISADPTTHSSSDCVVLAITGDFKALSYCRVGDTKWTNIEESPVLIEDIIYHDGRFYAIDERAVVMAFDSLSPDAVATIIVGNVRKTIQNGEFSMLKYLVISSGVLLKVLKRDDDETTQPPKFIVYALQKSESPIRTKAAYTTPNRGWQIREEIFYKWVKLESLGDQMLLLGSNSSISLPAHLFPNFKSSCIYFTDDFVEKHYFNLCSRIYFTGDYVEEYYFNLCEGLDEVKHDMGIFDMHDGSIQSYCLHGPTFLTPSIWVIPNIG